jgi:hypothetical protein
MISNLNLTPTLMTRTINRRLMMLPSGIVQRNQQQQLQLQLQLQLQQQQHQKRSLGSWPKVRPKRIRMVTFDVTGTLLSFRGTLEEHYLGAAKKYGVKNVDSSQFSNAFSKAYKVRCDECCEDLCLDYNLIFWNSLPYLILLCCIIFIIIIVL